jgi:hypothetical protein
MPAASVNGAGEFGAIRLLAALNLDKFADSASDLRQLASD